MKNNLPEGMGGAPLQAHTLLTVQHFRPKDEDNRNVEFVRAHKPIDYPDLYKEIKKDKRVVKDRKITNQFVNMIVDCLTANTTTLALFDDFKYHNMGTGTTEENQTNTGLVTNYSGLFAAGTQVESTAGTYVYKSVATLTSTEALAITEHGVFNTTSDTGAGKVILDRTLFSAVNLSAADSIQFTFETSFSAGG
jgi:hypothetical protein